MHCPIGKAKVFPLLTLAFDKLKISQIVKILQEYSKFLGLTDNIVSKKTIIVKKDWLTIRNISIAIYRCKGEEIKLDTIKWLVSIADLFHLQITVLTMFFQI